VTQGPSCHIVVIGAGSTGAAIAHDLALRGLRVTVIERAGVASGTTGHNQGQLHSGARYAVSDPVAARECVIENRILRRIMPQSLELNGGLFVGWTEEHFSYRSNFLEACARCEIPARELPVPEALRLEPSLNPRIHTAVEIPDGVFDPYRICLSFLASARSRGAEVLTFTEVVGLNPPRGEVSVIFRQTRKKMTIGADLIVNAAGPWAGRVAALAGAKVEVEASAGVLATVDERVCNKVLNILCPPADGDIVVPLRMSSILGTTSWTVANPDDISIPEGHLDQIFRVAQGLVPGIRRYPLRGVMTAARPLMVQSGTGGRSASRGFACYDHAGEGVPGLMSIVGGKTTTARAMAEMLSDRVCEKLGIRAECRTQDVPLLPHRLGVVR